MNVNSQRFNHSNSKSKHMAESNYLFVDHSHWHYLLEKIWSGRTLWTQLLAEWGKTCFHMKWSWAVSFHVVVQCFPNGWVMIVLISSYVCECVKAVKSGVTFLKSHFQDGKCSEIRRCMEKGKVGIEWKKGRGTRVLFLFLLQMNQLLLKFSCECVRMYACGLIRTYELCALTPTALLLVTTNVIGKQQAIDPSSVLPHFFSTELKWVIFM